MRFKVGEPVVHPMSGLSGKVEATAIWPGNEQVVRIKDHWFYAEDTRTKA